MADKWPLANGNWSNAANWNDGTLPINGDTIYLNGKTVTLDVDISLPLSPIRNDANGGLGVIGGGNVTMSAGRTLTALEARAYSSNGGNTGILMMGVNAHFIGNVYGGTSIGNPGVFFTAGAGTRTISGNVYGGSAGNSGTSTASGITTSNFSGAIIVINGNLYGGTASGAYGIRSGANGDVIVINGNLYGGSATGTYGISLEASGTSLTVNGNIYGGTGRGVNILTSGTSHTISVTGNVEGQTDLGVQVSSGVNGTLSVSGNLIAGTSSAVSSSGIGFSITANSAIASSTASGVFSLGSCVITSGTTAANGRLPYSGIGTFSGSGPTTFGLFNQNGAITMVPSTAIGDYPVAGNVRSGIAYNYGTLTGTLAVPNPNQVAYGVAVDNTTGTAILTEPGLSALFEAALQPNAQLIVERSTNDNKAITFSWPVSGATITGQKSIDNGAYAAVAGAISFLRTESNRHYYTLAYNAADRATVESSIRYKMTDGTYTKYFNLHVVPSGDVDVVVTPLQAVVDQMIRGTRIEVPLGYTGTVGPVVVTDTSNNPIDISAPSELIISKKWRGDILVIPDGSINRSGAGNNQFTISASGATLIPGEHAWALRRLSDKFVFAKGDWVVKQTATKD